MVNGIRGYGLVGMATGALLLGLAAAESADQPKPAKYIETLKYSGPSPGVHAEGEVGNGRQIFVDRVYRHAELPTELLGADQVLTANNDKYFRPTNLLELTVRGGTVVSVAHDDRIDRPAWLTNQFQPVDLTVLVEGRPLKVFQHRAPAPEHLILGGDVPVADGTSCYMYVVFVQAARKP